MRSSLGVPDMIVGLMLLTGVLLLAGGALAAQASGTQAAKQLQICAEAESVSDLTATRFSDSRLWMCGGLCLNPVEPEL